MIQRKYLLPILMSAAIWTSCTNDIEQMDDTDNIRLSFDVAGIEEGVQTTRGTIITGDVNNGNKFSGDLKLYVAQNEGTSTAGKFAGASKVYTVSTPGSHNTGVKWPGFGLAFYAFAPASSTYNSDYPTAEPTPIASSPYTTYSAGEHIVPAYSSQKDLLFAFQPIRTLAANGMDVPLTFNHILSRITFQVRQPKSGESGAFTNGETLTLKSISLVNVKSTSTGTFGNGATHATTRFDWTTPSGKATYTMNFTSTSTIGNGSFDIAGEQKGVYLNSGSGDSMFMLPHANNLFVETNVGGAIVPADDSLLQIVYRISTESTDRTARFKLKTVASGHKWEMGVWTNYQFTIKANYITLNPITVAGWGNANNVPVSVEE